MSHVLWGRHTLYASGHRIQIMSGTQAECAREMTFRDRQGFTDLAVEPALRELIKRPKVGDTLDWAHGPGKVLEVGANGRTITVLDRIGRRWRNIERAAHGHWVRTGRAPEPVESTDGERAAAA